VTVIVAVQDAGRAKSRLGRDLAPGMRRTLVIAMLDDLLAALREVHAGRILVVSADAVYDPVTRAYAAGVLRDAGTGYNEAVIAALTECEDAPAVLILPGDLPHASASDLAQLLEALAEPGVVIAPSDDGGTSALGLHPPTVIPPAFGPDSAARHRDLAHAANVPCTVLVLASLRIDVDTLDDLARVWQHAGEATTALLEHLPISVPPAAARREA
jgi:2-phospho-L-lactate guanylyltransferase